MDPVTKTELVETLFKVILVTGILSTEPSRVKTIAVLYSYDFV